MEPEKVKLIDPDPELCKRVMDFLGNPTVDQLVLVKDGKCQPIMTNQNNPQSN